MVEDPFTRAVKNQQEKESIEEAIRLAEMQNHPAEMDGILADPDVPTRVKNILLKLGGYFVGRDEDDIDEEE